MNDPQPELRRSARAHLADRPTVAQNAVTIARRLRAEGIPGASSEAVGEALDYLAGLGQVEIVRDPIDPKQAHYQITAAGVAEHGRANALH